MIQLIPQLRILIACQPIDFRNGIDGLAALCKQKLAEDPFSGVLFVFRNRRGSALKLLCYDGYGYWLITRRLSEGRLRWWPDHPDLPLFPVESQQLAVLLYNGLRKPSVIWREISMPLLYPPLRTHFTSPEEIYGFHIPAGPARSQNPCRSLAHHPSLHCKPSVKRRDLQKIIAQPRNQTINFQSILVLLRPQ